MLYRGLSGEVFDFFLVILLVLSTANFVDSAILWSFFAGTCSVKGRGHVTFDSQLSRVHTAPCTTTPHIHSKEFHVSYGRLWQTHNSPCEVRRRFHIATSTATPVATVAAVAVAVVHHRCCTNLSKMDARNCMHFEQKSVQGMKGEG